MSNLDNLRALALMSVFCHHLNHVYGVPIFFFGTYGGVFGVQLFFLLSGYLIIQSAKKYPLKTYLIHRICRIFPAYLVIFLSIGLLFDIINKLSILEHPRELLINLTLMQHVFPQALMQFEILHVSWTLTLEVIWYLLAPFLVWSLYRHPHISLIVSITLSSIWASLASAKMLDWLYLSSGIIQDHNRYFFINNAFPAQLCFFVMGAYLFLQREQLTRIYYAVLVAVYLLIILFLSRFMHTLTSPSFVTGVGITALFIIALKAPSWNSYFLKWIANISYSFYLLHLFILDTAKNRWHWEGTEGAVEALALILGLSTLSFYLIEKPMMNLARRYTT